MKAIIPVAGAGTRLRPHTHTAPKPLLHVAGKPILGHILDELSALGPAQVIFVVGHMGDQIIDYVQRSYSYETLFIEQTELLGLGYAIYLALEHTGDEDVLILLGDTIIHCDLQALAAAGRNVLGLKAVDDPQRFGIAEVERDRIVRLVEKPERPGSDLAVVGVYYIRDAAVLREELKRLIEGRETSRGEYQITDALQGMIDRGCTLHPFPIEAWYDCGRKETLLATNRALLAQAPGPMGSEGAVFVPPVFVAPDAVVDGAVIGPYVSIGAGARVSNCIVRDSIISAGARVSDILLEGSLVGNGTEIRGHYKKFNVGDDSEVTDL
jgi:glucose-1-phosphate thymidylyltransferase